jgi:hypothetical protein
MNLVIEVFGLSVSGWAIYFYLRRQPALDDIAVRVRWYGASLSAILYFGALLVFKSLPTSPFVAPASRRASCFRVPRRVVFQQALYK